MDCPWGDVTECSICMDSRCDIVHSKCGSNFCEGCLTKLDICPTCRGPFMKDRVDLLPIPALQPTPDPAWEELPDEDDDDFDVDSMILNHTRCSHHDCPQNAHLIVEHLSGWREAQCINLEYTVKQVKEYYAWYASCGWENVQVIFQHSPLLDNLSLSGQNVKSGQTLHFRKSCSNIPSILK